MAAVLPCHRQVPWQRRPARHPHQCARVRAGGGEWQRGGGEQPHLHHTSLDFLGKNTCAKTVGTAVIWWLIGPAQVHGRHSQFLQVHSSRVMPGCPALPGLPTHRVQQECPGFPSQSEVAQSIAVSCHNQDTCIELVL